MSAVRRVSKLLAGVLAGLLLVEGGLQLVRLAATASDSARSAHARETQGGELRVLCLGACYTVGVGTPAEQSYPAHLERALEARGLDAVVLNRGVRGRSIDYFAGRIDGLLDAHSPDVVVVGINRRMAPAEQGSRVWAERFMLAKMVSLALSPAPASQSEGVLSLDEDTRLEETGADDYLTRKLASVRAQLESDPASSELWEELADLEAGRGDFEAAAEALLQSPGAEQLRPPVRMRLFRYAVGAGDYAQATEQLSAVRQVPGFPEGFARRVGQRQAQYAADGRDVAVRSAIDQARVSLVLGDPTKAGEHIDEALSRDPDSTDAHQLRLYLLHLAGEPLPAPSEATLGRASEPASDPRFAESLGHYLDQIQAAAGQRGARVVVHTLGATTEQLPMIHEVAQAREIPVVDILAAMAQEDSSDRLFHPTDHLRLSAEGNQWMAEQVLATLDAARFSAVEAP